MSPISTSLLVEVMLGIIASVAIIVAALIAAIGGLAKVWYKHYLESRRSEDP